MPRIASVLLAALLAAIPAARLRADDPAAIVPRIDAARMKANLAALASDAMNGRSFRSEDGRRAAEWIAAKLAEAGAKPLEGRDSMLVPVARMPAASPNVVAWIPPAGGNPSGEYILVTAHYDHLPNARAGDDRIFNGADDNASGVCGLIAVAEAMRDDRLDVGVVFVGFTGEEAGLVGSRAFVEEETLPVARLRGMFNMDMISRQPDGAIRLDGGPKGKVLVDLLVRLAPQVPIEMKVDTHPDWLMRSDQGAFLGAGVPAVLFSCEDHEDYHKVTDHADKCDEQLMARVAALVTAAVRTHAAEMAPRFDRSPVLGDDGTQRRAIRVGRTMPNAPYWKPATRRDPDRGLDAALLAEIAKKTGWTFEERPVSPADQCTALAEGEVDIILNGAAAALAGTPGLARPIVAVEPPYRASSGTALLVRKDSTVSAETELATLRIAVRAGTAASAFLAQQQPSLAPVAGNEPDGALASRIEKGELDALAGDALALEARAAKDPAFRVVRLSSESTHILCRADDSVLREALSRVLRERPADIDATDSRRDEPEPSKGEPARPAP
ncbi:MAG: hypothetical protein RL354_1079 [Planctomycetota bacterium]